MIEKGANRVPYDLKRLGFQKGKIGEVTVIDCTHVIAGDSYDTTITGAFKTAQFARDIALDAKIELMSFYIPHRHIYGDAWTEWLQRAGHGGSVAQISQSYNAKGIDLNFLGLPKYSGSADRWVPKHRIDGYERIINEYFKYPYKPDISIDVNASIKPVTASHLDCIWSAQVPSSDLWEADRMHPDPDEGLNIYTVQNSAANVAILQERDYFANRYRDVVQMFGGKTTADVDDRPILLSHTEQWSSGYDVDQTDSGGAGDYTGKSTGRIVHNVPRYFVPEHGCIWTVMVVRYPPVVAGEKSWLDNQQVLKYDTFAGDPTLITNASTDTQRFSFKDFFAHDGSGSINVAWGQQWRYKPNFVNDAFGTVAGYPFLKDSELNVNDYIDADAYDQIYVGAGELGHWRFYFSDECTVMRDVGSTRSSLLLEPK